MASVLAIHVLKSRERLRASRAECCVASSSPASLLSRPPRRPVPPICRTGGTQARLASPAPVHKRNLADTKSEPMPSHPVIQCPRSHTLASNRPQGYRSWLCWHRFSIVASTAAAWNKHTDQAADSGVRCMPLYRSDFRGSHVLQQLLDGRHRQPRGETLQQGVRLTLELRPELLCNRFSVRKVEPGDLHPTRRLQRQLPQNEQCDAQQRT